MTLHSGLRISAGVLLCLLMIGAQAEGLESRSELQFWRTDYLVRTDSVVNMANRVAHQPDHVWSGEWRPDLTWSDEAWRAQLKPRVSIDRSAQGETRDAWLNEGWLSWRPPDGVSLQAGREALLWGPSMFWNPSNPFYTQSGKANPQREVAGKDFARARWQLDGEWALSAISQLGRGHAESGPAHVHALKLDWTGAEASSALIASVRPEETPELRGWAQWTANDALLVYGEAAWLRRSAWRSPVESCGSTGWCTTDGVRPRAVDVVLGTAYTFEFGRTLNVEYFQHGSGLSDAEAARQNAMAAALAPQLSGPYSALVRSQLAGFLNPGPSPQRRHYLALQLNEASGKAFGWTLRYARNLDDQSGEGVVQLKYDLGDQLQVWGNIMARHGKPQSEYGRWLRSQAMIGLAWFM